MSEPQPRSLPPERGGNTAAPNPERLPVMPVQAPGREGGAGLVGFFRRKKGRAPGRSAQSTQLALAYVASLAVYAAGLYLVVAMCWSICAMFAWQPGDPLYWILSAIRNNIYLFMAAALFVGWFAITVYFFSRPLRYLDEVVEASRQLASPGEAPIRLPRAMRDVEDRLNLVRQQALRNAAAAKEAEQRKNDLIVYLAHDLKTPLTSVIGYLTLLQDEPQLSPELRARYTGIALDKAERLEELINEFFEITRFNLTHLELERRPTDLARMLEQVASEFEPLLCEKDLRCELHLPAGLSYNCDPDKMARVFDNLLRNACYYSFAGTAVEIAARSGSDALVLTVENQGSTIPPEKLDRLFEQFYRLDSSRATATGGSGLGLAIARQIVELHGGSIRAESENNRIRFTLRFPLE